MTFYRIEWNIDGGNKEKLYIGGDAYSAAAVYIKQDGKWALHYILRDYLGSITHVTNANGAVEQKLSYDAWGNLRDPKTHVVYVLGSEPALLLGRGYTGHEHLSMYGLIHMNARLYDPAIGRFLSPDPYVEAPDFSQNFNRYSYALNNPLRYTDPSGEFLGIDDFFAGLVGGTVNLVSNILAGNVRSFAHGAVYFGIGAAGGVMSLYATPIAGAAFISGANSIATQGFTKGFGNIDWGEVGGSSLIGGIIGGATMGISHFLSPLINNLTSNIASPVLQNGLSGFGVGFGVGTGIELINGGDLGESLQAGLSGGAIGFAVGAASGTAKGFRQVHQQKISPWNGSDKKSTKINFSERATTDFEKHAFAKDRHSNIKVSNEKIASNTKDLIMKNSSHLHEGDNTHTVTINDIPKIIRVNVDNGLIRSFNLMPNNGTNIRSATPVIKIPSQKW